MIKLSIQMREVNDKSILELCQGNQTALFTIVSKQRSWGILYKEKILVLRGKFLGLSDAKNEVSFDMHLQKQIEVKKIDLLTQYGKVLLLKFQENGRCESWNFRFGCQQVAQEWTYLIWKILNHGKESSKLKIQEDGQKKINPSQGSCLYAQDSSTKPDSSQFSKSSPKNLEIQLQDYPLH